ncbi:autotransporter outer membrane beta-barrel domain-containing protein [Erwinia sp. DT-104]|uniref:autotransporter outer membrane beta-barrel domain-containing protein n=1 Tax=Erwinia sp. DT-104 TaxID=3396161 RepID=UPI003F1A6863
MEKISFRLSAVALSVLFGLSATAMAASVSSVSVPDVSSLSKNNGYYSGGGSVFIGGSDLARSGDATSGASWQSINTKTAGFNSLVNSTGYTGYLDKDAATLAFDSNHFVDEDYERSLHGERQVSFLAADGHSRPTNIIQGLLMGTAESRYTKTQSVTLYQRDTSGNIQYQQDADGNYVLDTAGNRIPLTVSNTIELDRNSDVYLRPADVAGGSYGLTEATIYSKVKSLSNDVAAAVTVTGDLYETGWNGHARDVLSIKDSLIDNTLAEDAYATDPSVAGSTNEQNYSERPHAVGLDISQTGVNWQTDSAGNPINAGIATNAVPQEANIILNNVQIVAQNLAAVHQDNHAYKNQNDYSDLADSRSTALNVSGSGLLIAVDGTKLTGGVNGAGKSLTLSGHANRANIAGGSVLNGDIRISHDGYKPVITVTVKRDANGNYVATGTAASTSLQRAYNGNELNVTSSEINGDITAAGVTGYEIQLVDVTDSNAQVNIAPTVHTTAQAIYNNAVSTIQQSVLANLNKEWTPVAVNLNASTLNGSVSGTTTLNNPTEYGHTSGARVLTWQPDLSLSNGSVWNAATNKNGVGEEVKVSNLHDFNLSASTLNLVNLNETTATLSSKNRYENLSTARVVVHNNLTQDKDANGNYLASTIAIGKGVVEPLLDLGGSYVWGSLQVKGSAAGHYQLNIASSGIEPYSKNGYLASGSAVDPHSFVNYKDANSDAWFHGETELGVYQYIAVNEYNDAVQGERNVYFKRNGKLSNSAATAVSLPAAQANVAVQKADALASHLNAARHADADGVWLSWFGGTHKNKVAGDASYKVKTNGLMLGVDSAFDADKGGSWLTGAAFSSSRSSMDVKNSSGDIDSYGAQFYLSRRYDNGVFVDTQAQFDHFSNSADVRMLGGGRGEAEFSSNGYGLGVTLGYAWQYGDFSADPYAKLAGRTFEGAKYTLSNGMVVNNSDYNSVQGELGVNLGYDFKFSAGYVKPYFHLAGIHEFADDNKARINNVTLNNSIDGTALQVGAGAELKFDNSISGYAGLDYTKGGDIERPWQATLGVNYSW